MLCYDQHKELFALYAASCCCTRIQLSACVNSDLERYDVALCMQAHAIYITQPEANLPVLQSVAYDQYEVCRKELLCSGSHEPVLRMFLWSAWPHLLPCLIEVKKIMLCYTVT